MRRIIGMLAAFPVINPAEWVVVLRETFAEAREALTRATIRRGLHQRVGLAQDVLGLLIEGIGCLQLAILSRVLVTLLLKDR